MELNKEYSYGDLTRGILGEEPKKGGSKTKQMKQIESIYKVKQQGRKYTLIEKYEKPKEIEDGRGKSTIYEDSFKPLVLNVLSQHYKTKEQTLCITSSMVMKDFAMADEELIDYYNQLDGISKRHEENTIAKDGAAIDYISRYRRKTMGRFTTVLKQLQTEGYLRYYPKSMRIKEYNGNYYWATDEQIEAIMSIEKEVLNEISKEKGFEITKNILKRYGLQTSFRSKVSKRLKQTENITIRNIEIYFDAIKIIMIPEFKSQLLDEKNKLSKSIKYLELSKASDIKSKDNDINAYKKSKMQQAENYANNEEHFEEYLNNKWDKNKRGLKTTVVKKWKTDEDIKREFLEVTRVRYEMYVGEYKQEYERAIEKLYTKLEEMEFDLDYLIDVNEFAEDISIEEKLKKLDNIDIDIIKEYLKEREEE